MGLSRIRIGAPALVAALFLGGDFALSTDEQLSAIDQQHAKLLECWDDDADGLCSYSEFLDSGQKLFNQLDVNGDGVLDQDEVQ